MLMSDEKIIKVTDRMRVLCSRREYCCADILKKATEALDGDRSAAAGIVARLVEEKYLDDLRYACAFARDKSSIQGWGAVKIRFMLSSKGVSAENISRALEEIEQDRAESRLDKLIHTKARSLKDDPQIRLKILRYALGRGYSYEEVQSSMKRVFQSMEEL